MTLVNTNPKNPKYCKKLLKNPKSKNKQGLIYRIKIKMKLNGTLDFKVYYSVRIGFFGFVLTGTHI